MSGQKNLEKINRFSSSGGVHFTGLKKNSGEYQTGDYTAWKQVIDCNSCIQSAIELETNYTCTGKFGLYDGDERVEYDNLREEYDYMQSLIAIGSDNDVASIRNHAYKYNAEKHAIGEIINYPRLNEEGKVTCIGIANSNQIYCKGDKLSHRGRYYGGDSDLDFYNDNNLRLRTMYKVSMMSGQTCGTSTIKTIFDRYKQDATMSNMFVNYLENNGVPGIIYLLKSAEEAGVDIGQYKAEVNKTLEGLKGPENANRSLASGYIADVKFPPAREGNIIDEDNRKKIESSMLKVFGISPSQLGEAEENGSYSKFIGQEKVYEMRKGNRAKELYESSINGFIQKFESRLLYPNLANYTFKSENKMLVDVSDLNEQIKCGGISPNDALVLQGKQPSENYLMDIAMPQGSREKLLIEHYSQANTTDPVS